MLVDSRRGLGLDCTSSTVLEHALCRSDRLVALRLFGLTAIVDRYNTFDICAVCPRVNENGTFREEATDSFNLVHPGAMVNVTFRSDASDDFSPFYPGFPVNACLNSDAIDNFRLTIVVVDCNRVFRADILLDTPCPWALKDSLSSFRPFSDSILDRGVDAHDCGVVDFRFNSRDPGASPENYAPVAHRLGRHRDTRSKMAP
mmetsp:Transcript_33829/g.93451  ORF Transcript_33829/g.93451 Transcript_33829/m.93451 type:complete len:202 (-) Transcript_33829:63-668(-)